MKKPLSKTVRNQTILNNPMGIQLIVGLRNPGSMYEQTRHNAGAWFVEALARRHNGNFSHQAKLKGELSQITLDGQDCRLLLPDQFMNHNGQAIQATAHFYKIKTDEILIVHDDLDLPVGTAKLKTGGGHGGHNGLRNTLSHLKSSSFHRLRIGIGHPGHKDQVHNYVLSKPSLADKQAIQDAIDRALAIIPQAITGKLALAMNRLHSSD